MFPSGRGYGTALLGLNVISSYGWLLKGNVSHGRIFVREAFRDCLFVLFVCTMRSVAPNYFFYALFLGRFGTGGGMLGNILVFMLPL